MVYVNSKKFACESCIKGHRSSSCHHTDRPLFEIKKKGRPVSQCEKCRELRRSRMVHSKCTCNPKDDATARGQVLASATSKFRRFIPIVPALPNGLRDVMAASQVRSSLPADARQKVDSLLNPCNCKSVWNCGCRQAKSTADKPLLVSAGDLSAPAPRCCDGASSSLATTRTAKIAPSRTVSLPSLSSKRHTPGLPSPQHHSHKRLKHHHSHKPSSPLQLPPIQSPGSPPPTNEVPDFGFMPPISTITSLAGSGCTCGIECRCPGCVVHRGSEYAAKDLHDCAGGACGTCVDNQLGVALPTNTSPFSTTSSSDFTASIDYITKSPFLNRFLARAAALPPPPPNRRLGKGVHLDPRDVLGFPPQNDLVIANQVKLPKLQACGGQCGDEPCCCDTSCGECHRDANKPPSQPTHSLLAVDEAFSEVSPATAVINAVSISPVSCCAGTP